MCLQRWQALAVPSSPPCGHSLSGALPVPSWLSPEGRHRPPHMQRTFLQMIKCFFLPPCYLWLVGYSELGLSWVPHCPWGLPSFLGSGNGCGPGGAVLEGPSGGGLGHTEDPVPSPGTAAEGPGQAWVPQPPPVALPNSQSSSCSALGGNGEGGQGKGLDLLLAQGLGPHAASNPFASQKFRDEWPAHA